MAAFDKIPRAQFSSLRLDSGADEIPYSIAASAIVIECHENESARTSNTYSITVCTLVSVAMIACLENAVDHVFFRIEMARIIGGLLR